MKNTLTNVDYFVHESSFVDQPTTIGAGTKIWHFSHVMAHASIGAQCNIGQNVFIASRVRIGNRVKIQNNVSLYEGVVVEDDVFLGPSMVFTNVNTPRSAIPRNTAADYAETRVKKGASIGANATIVCGNVIAEHAFVGAGSVVTSDVPAYALVYGCPAQLRGYVCACGLKLSFEAAKAICASCGAAYLKDSSGVKTAT
ncbi:MAG: N-acetyltransferase [Candidatus Eremiobacteraeota bacterium]|nr:N-acetyltransferase [Candidatus Eremiobacteraeota bacterium]